MELLARDRPGRSAARRHKETARAWKRRMFGRWLPRLLWALLLLTLYGLDALHLSSRLALAAGLIVGMFVAGAQLLPEALMPSYILNWQRGAWGEESTASELRRLSRKQWVVRHDIRWGETSNHDHVVAGRAVYVLNTKNVKDSRVSIEGRDLRMQGIDDPKSGYLADRWVPTIAAEARSLERRLEELLGFPVAVYPVIVLWGAFDAGAQWIDDSVAVVHGDKVAEWIASRPADILIEAKRARLAECVRGLPRAK